MKSLYSVAIAVPFATAMLFAQATQADRPADQADRPGAAATQADRPAGQATQPETQADRPAGQAGATSQSTTQSTQSSTSSQSTRTTGQADIGGAKTYRGTIVNADCSQASVLTSSMSTSASASTTSTAAGATAGDQSTATSSKSTSSKNPPKSRYDLSRDVIHHCAANKDTAAFAIVTDDGNFLKLDDSGNTQVKSNKWGKNTKVSATGAAEGETLKVQSITKM